MPVTIDLAAVGVLGIAGPPAAVAALARSLVVQCAVHHPPHELRLTLLVGSGGTVATAAGWAWTRWLPHLAAPGGRADRLAVGLDGTQISARIDELHALLERPPTPGRSRKPVTVLVLDGAETLRSVPGITRLLDESAGPSILTICLAPDRRRLPAECRAIVLCADGPGRAVVRRAGEPASAGVLADGVSLAYAERVARALAPLRPAAADLDDGSGPVLPESVRLLALIGLDGEPATVAERIAARWRDRPRATGTVLGMGVDGPVTVDLKADGPHVLVAGTTGSGKSELLQTLVAGLAVGNRPEELALLLIDYKGGAAFGECADLPHTVGVVTDLDGRLTARALDSLRAELRYRERILAQAGSRDLDDHLDARAAQPDRPGPPEEPATPGRLVLVVDEFAALAAELPDFVTGLVDVARRGRSLGVHLVLATQRPAGVVSAEIRSNAALRICLRVTDTADSVDVLDVPAAAGLPRHTPGRAWIRRAGGGAHGLVAVQAARIGGPAPGRGPDGPIVTTLSWATAGAWSAAGAGPTAGSAAAPAGRGTTELAMLVGAVRQAAVAIGTSVPRSPWLPPLPNRVERSALTGPEPVHGLALGLRDRPAEQQQEVYRLDLDGGHLAVLGAGRSGRTTTVRTLASAVAERDPGDVHLYVLDGGNELAALARLPHCAAVVGREDTLRAFRVLGVLRTELARRATGASDPTRTARLLLVVDSHEGMLAGFDDVDADRFEDGLHHLLREGPAGGLTVVLSGGRPLAAARLLATVRHRLVLRQADPDGYSAAGVAPRCVPRTPMPPGRALVPDGDGVTEVQIALGDPPAAPEPGREGDRNGPHRIRPLPDLVKQRDLAGPPPPARSGPGDPLPAGSGPGRSLSVLLGLGGDSAAPLGFDLAADGPGALIAGPPGSGRTTALRTAALGLVAVGTPVAVVAPRGSPLRRLAGRPGIAGVFSPGPDGAAGAGAAAVTRAAGASLGAEGLQELLTTHSGQPLVVVADDVEQLADDPLDALLTMVLAAGEPGWAAVVGGDSEELATQYRGAATAVRRHRLGILLRPDRRAPALLGARPIGPVPARPGLGLLVTGSRVEPIQVAVSDWPDDHDGVQPGSGSICG